MKEKCNGEYRYIINATPRGIDSDNPDWGVSIKPSLHQAKVNAASPWGS